MEEYFYYTISSCTESGLTYTVSYENELVVSDFYYVQIGGGDLIIRGCFTVTEELTGNTDGSIQVLTADVYESCQACLGSPVNPPYITAGTEYYVCVVCPDDGNTGYTYTSVAPPHPVASNAQLTKGIIQLNAVVIGGPNGLNS